MIRAVEHVQHTGDSVHKTSILYGVPEQTLRDRIKDHVSIDAKVGRKTVLTQDEEHALVEHIEVMGKIGYGYNKSEISHMASDIARKFGRKDKGEKMSNDWIYGFLGRWKNRLSSLKPRSLSSTRAYNTTQEVVASYYDQLKITLEKNNMMDKPHRIFNLDETGLNPEHRPHSVVAGKNSKPQALTSPRGSTTTVIACGNAIGNSLPPYFIFKGKRLMPELLKGCLPGTDAAMTDSGWSNGQVLQKYLETFFLKYVPTAVHDPVLLMYDGHASHVTLPIIQWARDHNIILFVLPPHTSHVLQPLDVSCFGPFKAVYYQECSVWMRENFGKVINRFNICELACKAYSKTMTSSNIVAGFRKTGISPFNPAVIPEDIFMPSVAFAVSEKGDVSNSSRAGGEQMVVEFLQKRLQERTKDTESTSARKKVKLGGRAITDDTVVLEIETNKSQPSARGDQMSVQLEQPQPSTSGKQSTITSRDSVVEVASSENTDDEDDDPSSNCCICGKRQPPSMKNLHYISFVNWAQCEQCNHWCHLRFCCDERAIRRHDTFLCPHCK